MRQLVVFISGPYRAASEYGVVENIHHAEECALDVWEAGHVALCPHKNTALFGGARGLSDDVWLRGDLELLRRCDLMYVVPDWQSSEGTLNEIRFAQALGTPVAFTKEELMTQLHGLQAQLPLDTQRKVV